MGRSSFQRLVAPHAPDQPPVWRLGSAGPCGILPTLMTFRHLSVCAAVCALLLTGCSVELYHGLTEKDANEIYVLLQENGISPTKLREEGGNEITYMINVPRQDAATAARLLSQNSLPRPLTPGLSAFRDSKGMIPTQTEERAMFLEAMGGEVERALNKIDGVLEARAIVMVPEQNDLTQPENKPKNTASVLVKYRPIGGGVEGDLEGRPPLTEEQIKRFVSTSLPEMTPDNVTVILSQALPPQSLRAGDSQLKDVLGFRMTAASATTFKITAAVGMLLFLSVLGFAILQLTRAGQASSRPARGRGRPE